MQLYYIANLRLPTEKAHGTQIMRMCGAFATSNIQHPTSNTEEELLAVGSGQLVVTLVVPFRWRTKLLRGVTDVFAYYGAQKNFRIVTLPSLDLFPLTRFFPFLDRAAFAIQYGSFLFFVFCFFLYVRRRPAVVYTRDSHIARLALHFTKHVFLELHTIPKQDDIETAQGTEGVIAVTRGLKNALVEHGIDTKKILVAPDAVDGKVFDAITASSTELRKQLHLPLDAKLIGYAGRLKTFEQEKGIPELLEAFALLQQERKDVRLVIVGHVSPTEVPKYLKGFDVLVAPFPKTPHYEIAMSPLKIFEYMAAHKPMVVSDLPSLREILSEDTAYFFEPGNAKNLAQTLERVFTHPAEASQKAERVQKISQEHTWEKRAEHIVTCMAVE